MAEALVARAPSGSSHRLDRSRTPLPRRGPDRRRGFDGRSTSSRQASPEMELNSSKNVENR